MDDAPNYLPSWVCYPRKRKINFSNQFFFISNFIVLLCVFFHHRTQVIHAIEDEPFNVSCKFKANPLEGAHIKWYRNGHIIETLHNPPKGMALTLKASKSTAGLYACQVENEVGRSSQV